MGWRVVVHFDTVPFRQTVYGSQGRNRLWGELTALKYKELWRVERVFRDLK